MATDLDKIGKMTFIQHTRVPKRHPISQFRFTCVKQKYFCYILCKFDSNQSTNTGDYVGSFRNKNRHILPNISASTGPNLTSILALLDTCMGIIKLTYVSW